jgi:CRP-like cAMP-binding protein
VPSFDRLRAYLEARGRFSEAEMDLVRATFVPRTLAAGEFLQRAGEPAKVAAFVARGCLRSYVIDDDGREHIVQFAPEEWWLGDSDSLATGAPSAYFIDAIEESELLLLDPDGHRRLIGGVPGYAAGFQTGIQRHAAAKDRRIVSALATTAEARYAEFLRTYSSIAARVPLRMLASYLGMTPETLSRVRRAAGATAPRPGRGERTPRSTG